MTGPLTVESASFAYDTGVPVLRDVSVAARPGQMLAVTGTSGAGKTTLLNAMAGLLVPKEGRVLLAGEPVGDRDRAVALGVVLIPQDNGLAAILTASAVQATPAGDATRGATVYEDKCTGCHSIDANRVGPAHRGVFGRKAGSAPDFAYSPGVKNSRIVWNAETLDRWLINPQATIPGSRMGFRLSDPQQRADVIAYLQQQSPPARRR